MSSKVKTKDVDTFSIFYKPNIQKSFPRKSDVIKQLSNTCDLEKGKLYNFF